MLNLRYVKTGCDFRKSEATNYEEFQRRNRQLVKRFKNDDVVLFVSGSGDQLCFVYGFRTIEGDARKPNKPAPEYKILSSGRLRLDRGSWSPRLLVNYARSVGLELGGLPAFEESLDDFKRKQLKHRRQLDAQRVGGAAK